MIRHDIPLTSCDIIFVILNDVSDICVAVRNLTLVSLFQCETTSLVFRKKSSKWTDRAKSSSFFSSFHSWNAIINEIMSGQIWSVVADVLEISRQLVDLHILLWPCVRFWSSCTCCLGSSPLRRKLHCLFICLMRAVEGLLSALNKRHGILDHETGPQAQNCLFRCLF